MKRVVLAPGPVILGLEAGVDGPGEPKVEVGRGVGGLDCA